MKKQLPYICLLLLLCLLLTACGSSQLIGRWVEEDGNDMLIFRKDGTGSADGFRFDWYISNGRLHIVLFEDEEMAFSVRGNKLSLQDVYSDGSLSRNVDVYIRQGGPSVPISTIVFCVIIAALLIISIRFGVFEKMLKHLPVDKELAESTTKAMGLDEIVSEKAPDAITKVKEIVPQVIVQVKEKIPEAVSQIKEKAPEAIGQIKDKVPEAVAQMKGKVASVPLSDKDSNSKVCVYCHNVIPSDAIFCPECGNEVLEEQDEGVCPQCGAELPEEAIFCPGCGMKVDNLKKEKHEETELHEVNTESTATNLSPTKAGSRSSEVSAPAPASHDAIETGAKTSTYSESPLSAEPEAKEKSSKLKISSNINQHKRNTGIKRSASFQQNMEEVNPSPNKRAYSDLEDDQARLNVEDFSVGPSQGKKICPKCKNEVRRGASVCKHCGYDFDMM